ncbi:peptidoglycan binding domain-containing protein [Clostridium sp.]|uniref:L,D-transpeptidase family protein n=1 Tax=Clostridium sp. TaxID=1506 RepID=UPI003F3C1E27
MEKLGEKKLLGNIIIALGVVVLLYFIASLYFINRFNIGTTINGVNVSGKKIEEARLLINDNLNNYELELKERGGEIEKINGNEISLKINENYNLQNIKDNNKSLLWGLGIFKKQSYEEKELVLYDDKLLKEKLAKLKCFDTSNIIEPKNASFQFSDTNYIVIDEVYGNKINLEILHNKIIDAVSTGKVLIDLEEINCYENPKFTRESPEVLHTLNILNKYVKANITYEFGSKKEVLDSEQIKEWLSVNDNLEVVISEKDVKEYLIELAVQYNTVGKTREFKSASGKMVDVNGGYYGWKINTKEELKDLIENIKNGQEIVKEPKYIQKAVSREDDDIGDTYVEINITNQYLWFHKDGKVIAQGDIVSGNINRGRGTALGTYMLTYKQKGAVLEGDNYRAEVKYWMPFNGNIGLHDASWRYSFGGDTYKSDGSHGCINMPEYLAKKVFENIEEGTPIVCYTTE